jgi:hypothetical protein
LGTYIHAAFVDIGLASLLAGFVVIEVNKHKGHLPHFESPHAILGFITYILLFIQLVVGATQFFFPQLYGGVENAKKIYKYHRGAGYVIVAVALATIAAATQTDFIKNAIHIRLWAVLVPSVLLLAGLYARIKKQKLGFN